MCLLIAISGIIDDAPLLVAANRDEFYARQALPMTVLREAAPRVLGGRDLVAGGTWMAVNEHGVVAALTNKPRAGERDPTKRSRGEIPLLLAAHPSAEAAVDALRSSAAPGEFNPCWVLVGDRHGLYSVDMTGPGPVESRRLPPGVHVLENKPLGSPSAKVDRVRELLGDCRSRPAASVIDDLAVIVADHVMPLVAADTSETAERQARISACCVHTELYGTRSSMTVCVPAPLSDRPRVWASSGPPCTHALLPVPFDLAPGIGPTQPLGEP
ncbi:MAG TPA: NRDE family protein [Acidimicrobiales bacterium]|nr:NRDE family protein [Acidimicrobiales bacterium]